MDNIPEQFRQRIQEAKEKHLEELDLSQDILTLLSKACMVHLIEYKELSKILYFIFEFNKNL